MLLRKMAQDTFYCFYFSHNTTHSRSSRNYKTEAKFDQSPFTPRHKSDLELFPRQYEWMTARIHFNLLGAIFIALEKLHIWMLVCATPKDFADSLQMRKIVFSFAFPFHEKLKLLLNKTSRKFWFQLESSKTPRVLS